MNTTGHIPERNCSPSRLKASTEKLGGANNCSYIYPVNELIKNKGYVKEF